MTSWVPRTGRLTALAFALTLFVASFSSAAAQSNSGSILQEKAEPLTVGSAVTSILNAGESALTEASRLLQSDPYWQFRGASYSNSGLLSEQDEVKLGTRLHTEFGKRFTIVSDGQERANRIGQRVARTSLRPNLTYRFHVIRDKELNAFSGPGGHIYITTALMNLASDDELASVLSHEVSHVVARHSLKTIQQSQNLKGLADLFGSVAGLAGTTAQEVGTATATIVAGGLLAVHNREEEREADFLGVHAMAKAGYNPQAMVTLFEKIQSAGEKDESLLGAVFADHPGVNERIENTRYEISRMR
ncbi:MAG TPA: M48 family metallopeptidase [Pyrinomonadaceae bacterium]|nr:M48 family metallopeptidase [Pyrinomonadaceae bacterium]